MSNNPHLFGNYTCILINHMLWQTDNAVQQSSLLSGTRFTTVATLVTRRCTFVCQATVTCSPPLPT